jgi:hypothetical protein
MPFLFHHSQAVRRVAAGAFITTSLMDRSGVVRAPFAFFNFDITPKLKEACTTLEIVQDFEEAM